MILLIPFEIAFGLKIFKAYQNVQILLFNAFLTKSDLNCICTLCSQKVIAVPQICVKHF